MRQELIAKLALGFAGICTAGGLAGVGLANYTTSGSFEFYKQQRIAEWQPQPPTLAGLESTDLAFASDHRSEDRRAAPEGELASLVP